jgi:hypothetical protein
VILRDNIVQVFAAAYFHRIIPPEVKLVAHAHEPQGGVAWFKAVQRDGAGFAVASERLAKEVASRRSFLAEWSSSCDGLLPGVKPILPFGVVVRSSKQEGVFSVGSEQRGCRGFRESVAHAQET